MLTSPTRFIGYYNIHPILPISTFIEITGHVAVWLERLHSGYENRVQILPFFREFSIIV